MKGQTTLQAAPPPPIKEEGDHPQRLSDHCHFQPNHGTNCNVHEFS